MSKRPWNKRNKQKQAVVKGHVAAASNPSPAGGEGNMRRVQFKTVIQNINGSYVVDADVALAQLVNEGWEIVHETVTTYYHPSEDTACHDRIVRLARMVDSAPVAVIPVVEQVEIRPLEPATMDSEGDLNDTQKVGLPVETIDVILPEPVAVPSLCGCYQPAW